MADIYAEEVNYWMTGKSSGDTWIDNAKKEIVVVGGKVLADGFMSDMIGNAAYMLAFEIGGERYKVIWPVLKPKGGNVRAARIQAATALYHEVKASCVKLKFLGAHAAFLAYWMLPDGRTAADATAGELSASRLFNGDILALEVDA